MTDIKLRNWKWEAKQEPGGDKLTGTVEAPDEGIATKKIMALGGLVEESIHLHDQGPIGLFVLSPDGDIFVKSTVETYGKATTSKEAHLKVIPTEEGRVWDLYLPNATQELLYAVHRMMEGADSENMEREVNEVTVVNTPFGQMAIPSVILERRTRPRPPSRPSPTEGYDVLDTRELMATYQIQMSAASRLLQMAAQTPALQKQIWKEYKKEARIAQDMAQAIFQTSMTTVKMGANYLDFTTHEDRKLAETLRESLPEIETDFGAMLDSHEDESDEDAQDQS
jgi:hypothetical protein